MGNHYKQTSIDMTIAVLMSVYRKDNPEYLDTSIRSVWTDQTLRPNQIVIIKDGPISTETQAVLNRWQIDLGDKLQVIQHSKNEGLTKSLNDGIDIIKTDLIARMDSDDISCPARFEKQAKYLSEHPDIDIVGGSLQEFDAQNTCLNIRHYPQTHQDAVNSMHKACPLAHPTVMMRRRIFDKGLRYDERFKTSQDIALWFDAVCAGYYIANIPDVTIHFRFAADTYSRRSKAKAWNEFYIYVSGIYRLNGLMTFKYFYPLTRLIFRLMPARIIQWGYGSRLRSVVTNDKTHRK